MNLPLFLHKKAMTKRFSILLIYFFSLSFFAASQVNIEGLVFVDKNKDGVHQQGEKLLKNILISNGDTIIKTDKKGYYQITVTHGSSVFPILPGNYSFNSKGITSRAFRNIAFDSKENDIKHNFALIPVNNPDKFRVDVVGDVQVNDMQELYYAQQTIFTDLIQNGEKDFNLFMGDLSNDKDSILLKIRDAIGTLPSNSWSIAGNHDMTEAKPRSSALFNKLFGSDIFAFSRGKTCFIGLNNSKGYLPQTQLRFLRQLMHLLPKDVLPVISQHIPIQALSNHSEMLEAIGSRKCLVLSAHAHIVGRQFWNKNIQEWVVGASCGSWWVGEKNLLGIPSSIQQCGSPRNYFQLFINGNDYNLVFKGIDSDDQMNIWIKGQDALDDSIPALSELPDRYVVANIFAGSDSTIVEYSINNEIWMPMTHTAMADPIILRTIEWNSRKYFPSPISKRIPLRKRDSPHIWTCTLPELDKGTYTLKIRASDNYGMQCVKQSRMFYISGKEQ